MPLHSRWSENDRIPEEHAGGWRSMVRSQAGVVSFAQLRAYGHSWHDVASNVAARRWQRVLPRVYATFTGQLGRAALMHAAVLYGGKDSVLSHRTAAEEWRMVPIRTGPIEITVPYGSSAVSQMPVVRVHRSRALAFSALASVPPRTRKTDTIVDLAVAEPDARSAMYLVIDLVAKQALSVPEMLRCVEARPPLRYRSAIGRALQLAGGGLMSALEVEYFDEVERAHGFPPGRRQVPVVVDGKTLWEDVVYEVGGESLVVRLDGRAAHSVAGVAFRDRRRDNAAELAGRARLVYGWWDVHRDSCGVAGEVGTVLARLGWVPGPRECLCRLEP
ncbi:hypothetical protein [Amycolatopsis dendrobii]|uniref:Transcriptional regulator, AbiEi antitoxin, Type IV TA system n=1 Tax=Amycolatopsis dendrobii TaxID=2760662 RepID=A0A7W3W656_9PSEU|nr:hypothetical protein [Amycolatopsis dendrobii]MBB1159438.1 hypothetical protein [Amycolatopsis dendrobii]